MSGRTSSIPIALEHLLLPRRMAVILICAIGASCSPTVLSTESKSVREEAVDFTRATVIHAAGAIQVTVPADWHVLERPIGREIRLWLTPVEPNKQRKLPSDGLSITYRYNPGGPRRDLQELKRVALARLDSITRGQVVPAEPSVSGEVTNYRALRVAFAIPSTTNSHPGSAQKGFFLFVETQWGDCELFASSPLEKFHERQAELNRIVQSLRLGQPTLKQQPIAPNVRDAEQIIGSWKAYRSRMTLSASGRISIQTDRAETVSSGWPADDGDEITGQYTAQGDVLLISWNDNSKLNFRWRLHHGRLLLTDHEGRTSHLSRILTLAESGD